MTRLNPYISFKNNAREAMEFYQSVLGGDLTSTPSAATTWARTPPRTTSSCTRSSRRPTASP